MTQIGKAAEWVYRFCFREAVASKKESDAIAPLPANLIRRSGRSPALPYPPYEQSNYYYVPNLSLLFICILRLIFICTLMRVRHQNLTSFNRYCSKETFCLFFSGYNNSCKAEFLKKIFVDNSQKKWLHFGDTDPDGFLILHNLRTKTGIDFQPYHMGIYELTCFERYCKPLEPNDITKAKSMVENQIYPDIARFMLDSNHKLEQEIIS